ncbi:hypothetical protein [Paenibacillus anaericanus]|nr:hypothetical protein [Paenibacillus anaericanus]
MSLYIQFILDPCSADMILRYSKPIQEDTLFEVEAYLTIATLMSGYC